MNSTSDEIVAEASPARNALELRELRRGSQILAGELPAHNFGKVEERTEARDMQFLELRAEAEHPASHGCQKNGVEPSRRKRTQDDKVSAGECGSEDNGPRCGHGETQGPSTAQNDSLRDSLCFAGDDSDPEDWEVERERRIYRGRTVAMLRRYMRYSIETGRLPSLLGREFFRAKVTSYTVVTFEDRVIFVHDMETCLEKLDEFSRQIIARHILQEHDRWATARLLNCNEKTIRRLTPLALDMLTEILLDVGLLERLDSDRKKSCQGGLENEIPASGCEYGENKF